MAIKIDEATGLPELPEGHYWDISADYVQIRKYLPDGEWGRHRPYADPYDKANRKREETRKVWVKDTASWRGTLFDLKREVTEYRHVNRNTGVVRHMFGSALPDYIRKEDRVPTSQENLLARCVEVYTAWQSKVDRESIYGVYPPRKFTEES